MAWSVVPHGVSWNVLPLVRRDFDFFDRQKDLFSNWVSKFGEDWSDMGLLESLERFDQELGRVRKHMLKLEPEPTMLQVENPFITDASGNRKLSLRFDCSQFKPDEITVKSLGNKLCVHAQHYEETKDHKIHREFRREYSLPDQVDPSKLKSTLSKDGVLTVQADVPASIEAPKENLVPIEQL